MATVLPLAVTDVQVSEALLRGLVSVGLVLVAEKMVLVGVTFQVPGPAKAGVPAKLTAAVVAAPATRAFRTSLRITVFPFKKSFQER
ncbi:hypothetical protein, partial [Thermomonospora echinospora]|uniref:hypothetical protein n=1 Tax=Thermomonospora echinospora TaxID=1992 RepID=UPI001F3048D2